MRVRIIKNLNLDIISALFKYHITYICHCEERSDVAISIKLRIYGRVF